MDNTTRQVIDGFAAYITQDFQKDERFTDIVFKKWTLQGYKVSVEFELNNKVILTFDVREILENKDRFSHLLSNAMDQLAEKSKESL